MIYHSLASVNSIVFLVACVLYAPLANADFLFDSVLIKSDSPFSGDPITKIVTVSTPGIEVPYTGAGPTLISNMSVNIEASSISLLVESGMFLGGPGFIGLRFTSLDSPGEIISGFTVQSSIGGSSSVFDPSSVTFGSNFVDIDLTNPNTGYSAGDSITVNLQLTAVPEPSVVLLCTLSSSILLLRKRQTKRCTRVAGQQ